MSRASLLPVNQPASPPYVLIAIGLIEFCLPYEEGMNVLNNLRAAKRFNRFLDHQTDKIEAFMPLAEDTVTYCFMTAQEYSDRHDAQVAGKSYSAFIKERNACS